VRLIIIPYCENEEEQIELLKIISKQIETKEKIDIDVTHGFRHLPMLALLSALHMRLAYKAEVQAIWYASYDPETEKSNVYDLVGLLKIADWLQALSAFDKDGDYRVFSGLLKQSGMETTNITALQEAGFYENILNVGDATGKLRQVTKGMNSEKQLTPDAKLLLPHVKERLDWINEEKQFEKQCKLGNQALKRGDYLHSVLYAYEAVITRVCHLTNANVNDFKSREEARGKYEAKLRNKSKDNKEKKNYFLLKQLRNQVAHGSRGTKGDIQKILLNEENLRNTLDKLLTIIRDHELPED
jgi:CRISPR-associated DxTHG motif protein